MSATFATVRSLARAMSGMAVDSTYGREAFKLNGQILACRAIHKSAEPNSLVVKVDFGDRDELIASAPEVYYVTEHYVNYPSVLVRLSKIDRDTLEDLLLMSARFLERTAKTKARKPRATK